MLLELLEVVLVGFVFFLVWALRDPVPHNISRPIAFRLIRGVYKVIIAYNTLREKLGRVTRVEAYRELIEAGKARKRKHIKPNLDGLEVTKVEFDGVTVRVYRPVEEHLPGYQALVYFHGGGWIMSDIDSQFSLLADVARLNNMVVVNVEYRLAPEFLFPVPLQDCVTATKYFLQHAKEFGADPSRVAVGGDSAGGNLAAAVAMKLRDERFHLQPKCQILLYPPLQGLDFSLPSMIQNEFGPFLTKESMAWMYSMYICGTDKYVSAFLKNSHTSKEMKQRLSTTLLNHDELGEEFHYEPYKEPILNSSNDITWYSLKDKLLNPYLCPLMAKDFSGLPKTYIYTGQYDVLRDDGILFAKRLQNAGIKVAHKNKISGFHGAFRGFGLFKEETECFDEVMNYIKEAL